MDIEDTLSTRVAQIHSEAIRLAQAAWLSVAAYVVILTIGGMSVDQMEDFAGPNLALNIATLVLGFWVVISMLRKGQLAPSGLAAGFGTYFGLSFLSGLATLLGLALLLIPGLVLVVRWAPIYGYGLVDGEGVGDAFGKSWDATDGHFAPIAVAMVLPLTLYAVTLVVYVFGADEYGLLDTIPSLAANLGLCIAGIATTAIGIAVYSLLSVPEGELTKVFE